MIDLLTNEPLLVKVTQGGMPYIKLLYSQLEQVRQVLVSHGVRRWWWSENVLSFNGGPEMTTIYLGNGGDAKAVQAILNSVPDPSDAVLQHLKVSAETAVGNQSFTSAQFQTEVPEEGLTMIDTTTKQPLRVLDIGSDWPCIRLPYVQVDEVRKLLEQHGIRHWVGENVMSFNGGPEIAYIHLVRGGDGEAVQAILDGAR